MNKSLAFFFFCLIPMLGYSQNHTVLSDGEQLVNKTGVKSLRLQKDIGSFETSQEGNDFIHKASTTEKPENVFQLSVKIPLVSKMVKAGQPMLITFKAMSLKASLETNEAKINWLFRQTESLAPKDVISKSISLSANWQTYYIPFKAIHTKETDSTFFVLQFGYPPQIFDIKDIELYVFPEKYDYKKLPYTKITYAGMDDNAAWRKDAEKRIEEGRKDDFTLFFYKDGKPLTNTVVEIKQVKHFFRFGAAISTAEILNQPKYFEMVQKLFNTVVFENDLKAKRWKNIEDRAATLKAIDKLNANGLKVKGHVLLWPGFSYLPGEYQKKKDKPDRILQLINENYKSILTATKGKISHWDVLNEAYTNKDIPMIFGSNDILFDAFTKAKEFDPNAKRYINEYGIISGGGINKTKQDWYYNFIQEIDQKTGAIDGLGMQSHIGSDLTPPTKVIEILNRFSELNKEIAISEFTIDITDDEELRAKYTRDFMIAAFSNPMVKEFLFWGFYAPMHPKAALLDQNYELTPMGKAYYDLVFNHWSTKLNETTDNNGILKNRGFYGNYEFTIKHEGKTYNGTFEILPNETNKLKISLQ